MSCPLFLSSPPPQVLLVYEWECLIQEVEQLQSSFDQALMMLRHEKAGIDASVITADLRLEMVCMQGSLQVHNYTTVVTLSSP